MHTLITLQDSLKDTQESASTSSCVDQDIGGSPHNDDHGEQMGPKIRDSAVSTRLQASEKTLINDTHKRLNAWLSCSHVRG